MKKLLLPVLAIIFSLPVFSQKIDSIFFNLYTDSLKKGQHNYINIDGKLSNGKWMPLTTKDVQFSCDIAEFEGNQLIIPENFKPEKVVVKAVLKSNPSVVKERTIWIKTRPDPELPSNADIMNPKKSKNKNKD